MLPKIKPMNIHQLSVIYDERHDRLILKLNTQDSKEFRFWLTRRMAIRLIPALDQSVVKLEAAQPGIAATDEPTQKLLTELKRDAFLQTADFATPYSSEPQELPLGDEPLLITDAQLNMQANGSLQVTFQEKLGPNGQSCLLNLQAPLVHGLIHLIRQSMTKADWGWMPQGEQISAAESPSAMSEQPAYKH